MKEKYFSRLIILVTILMVMAGIAGAYWPQINNLTPIATAQDTPTIAASNMAPVDSAISYQGSLLDDQGNPSTGSYTMRFQLWDAELGGTSIWNSGNLMINVTDGIFNTNLAIDPADFNGTGYWLSIEVDGEMLTPRQELLPAPYALTLRPGAQVVGDGALYQSIFSAEVSGFDTSSRAIFGNTATGDAIYGNANGGYGLVGSSVDGSGLYAFSSNKAAGKFFSSAGYGIEVTTNSTDHWESAGYFQANGGYGIMAQSSNNHGVYAIGNQAGVRAEGGSFGVSSWSANGTGVSGNSDTWIGVSGNSNFNYGGYFTSSDFRGLFARGGAGWHDGYFNGDTGIFVNGSCVGCALAYQAINRNDTPLQPGDLVAIAGMSDPLPNENTPILEIEAINQRNTAQLIGIVSSAANYNNEANEQPGLRAVSGSVATDQYLYLIVQGITTINIPPALTNTEPGAQLGFTAGVLTVIDPNSYTGPIIGRVLGPNKDNSNQLWVMIDFSS
ncbi:MAG TPA: hypothetical protein VLL52_21090 [Anaerolineae bacterium]|nr:hypothetical protein [Anaerolineae bacterium]